MDSAAPTTRGVTTPLRCLRARQVWRTRLMVRIQHLSREDWWRRGIEMRDLAFT